MALKDGKPKPKAAPKSEARRRDDGGAAAGKKHAAPARHHGGGGGSSSSSTPAAELWREERDKARKQNKEMGQMHTTSKERNMSQQAAQSRKGGRKRVTGEGDDLINSFKERLAGGTFRMLNEQIYTTPSVFAAQLLRDRETFNQYHDGYRHQVAMWPCNPVDLMIASMKEDKRGRFIQHKSKHLPGFIPPGWVIADMGCGDAAIAQAMKDTANKVHSFDFCAPNELVTPADMKNVPLEAASVDICIFSLSLMSTNFLDYLYEAHRILKPNKLLKIAEVRSRLPDPERFALLVESIGYTLDWWGVIDGYFCVFDFVRKEGEPNREPFSAGFDPTSLLTPCLYKRR
jgi:ribosomal RNA-processing protein 8